MFHLVARYFQASFCIACGVLALALELPGAGYVMFFTLIPAGAYLFLAHNEE